jgi:glycosyltransferase involved in cell wall biosynthesis
MILDSLLVRPTVIVPFHRNLEQFGAALAAVRRAMPEGEVLIAADGARDDCRPLAAAHNARVIVVPGPSGPAVARNRAAVEATGDLLVFVDADVVMAPDAIQRMSDVLTEEPALSGVFGAYDHAPAAQNFMSQFKNLSHTYVHEVGNRDAKTFWAGLGAVRTAAFRQVGGYDERFRRPSVEDIDLGYRLTTAGFRLRLDPSIRGKHLKRWTLRSCIVTDVQARGVPWTQLIHRFQALSNDLNTSFALRASVVLSYSVVAGLAAVWVTRWGWLAAGMALMILVLLNADYYRWFARERGWLFASGVVAVHLIHHLCNGVSFVVGTTLHLAGRAGIRLPGALPPGTWASDSHSASPPAAVRPS